MNSIHVLSSPSIYIFDYARLFSFFASLTMKEYIIYMVNVEKKNTKDDGS
jgi:hypothetical protein